MNKFLVKERAKRGVYLAAASAGSVTPLRSRFKQELRILMYHKVNDARPNTISVGVNSFAHQQQLLSDTCNVIPPGALGAALAHPGGPKPQVVLTFDDGYRDNLVNAYPILKQLGHRAFLFIPTDYVGGKQLPHDRKLATSNLTLGWDDLRLMMDVFVVGSHGKSHTPLTRLSLEAAREEIRSSKEILEDRLQVEVTAFSYPRGTPQDFSSDLEQVVADAGYRYCFTTVPGGNRSDAGALRLKRVNVEDFGAFYFQALLRGSADVVGIKDTKTGARLKAALNHLLGTGD